MDLKKWRQLYVAFFKVGLLTIGGGYAMLPIIEREIVVDKKWLTMDEILESYSVAQSLPGVIASNTAVFVGYKLGGVLGAIACVLGVITPSILIILGVAAIFNQIESLAIVQNAFKGIRIVVLALLCHSMVRMVKASIKDYMAFFIALSGFIFVMFYEGSPIITIVIAGIIGAIVYKGKVS